jgi:hypothetical protein
MVDSGDKTLRCAITHEFDRDAGSETDFQDTVFGLDIQQRDGPVDALVVGLPVGHDEARNVAPETGRPAKLRAQQPAQSAKCAAVGFLILLAPQAGVIFGGAGIDGDPRLRAQYANPFPFVTFNSSIREGAVNG